MVREDADVELRRLAADPAFKHPAAAVRALRYRTAGKGPTFTRRDRRAARAAIRSSGQSGR